MPSWQPCTERCVLVESFSIEPFPGVHMPVIINASMSMIDGKMRSLLTVLGGAYCTVNSNTASGRCADGEKVEVERFFSINRSATETLLDYERLKLGDGSVKRRKADYSDRKGLTKRPVLEDENLYSVSPLHSLMQILI